MSDPDHSKGRARHHAHWRGRCEVLQVIVRRTLADPVDPIERTALIAFSFDVANTLKYALRPTLGHISRSGIQDGPNCEQAEGHYSYGCQNCFSLAIGCCELTAAAAQPPPKPAAQRIVSERTPTSALPPALRGGLRRCGSDPARQGSEGPLPDSGYSETG